MKLNWSIYCVWPIMLFALDLFDPFSAMWVDMDIFPVLNETT